MRRNYKLIIGLVMIHSLAGELAYAADAISENPSNLEAPSKEQLSLNYLMQAEMAASRGLFKEALLNYLLLADLTSDPEIAEIASEYALELRDVNAALRAVNLWATNAPNNLEAQLIAVSLFIDKEPNKANNFLQQAFKLNVAGIDEHLVNILYKLSETGRKNLTTLTQQIADQEKNNVQIQLAMANIFANQLMISEAKPYLAQTFKLAPKSTGAMQLQAKLIRHDSGSDVKALEYLKVKIKDNPNDFTLREFYTNALIDNGQAKQAIEQLKILAKNKDYGAEAAIQLGDYYLSSNDYKDASKYFHMAMENDATKDLAYYNLGQLAEYQKNPKEAVEWYVKIDPASEHQANGFLRAAFIYADRKEYDTALQVIQNANPKNFTEQKQLLLTQIDLLMDMKDFEEANNTATHVLSVIPDDIEFLYVRSLIRNNLQQYKPAEEDLLEVLKLDPHHANALNALAYTLGHQPNRIKQAITYIDQALAIAPNNPAFMDSKGWLLLKDGEIDKSLAILREAYKLSQETMIATHYGEALWNAGKQNDAKKVWAKALATNPNNISELTETLNKYNLKPQDL